MRFCRTLLSTLSALLVLEATNASAGTPIISSDEKAAIVASLNSTLQANYAFPDIANKIAPVLQEHLKNGGYDAATTQDELAALLTKDLIKVSGDWHFFVGVDPKWVAETRNKADPVVKAKIRSDELANL